MSLRRPLFLVATWAFLILVTRELVGDLALLADPAVFLYVLLLLRASVAFACGFQHMSGRHSLTEPYRGLY